MLPRLTSPPHPQPGPRAAAIALLLAAVAALPACDRPSAGAAGGGNAPRDPAAGVDSASATTAGQAGPRPEAGRTPPGGGARVMELSGEPAVLVRTGSFIRKPISSSLRVHADLEAVERADVPPQITGVVKTVLAREGDRVQKGAPVVQLDDEELRLIAETKKVLWEQARAKVQVAELAARELDETVRTKKLLAEKAQAEFERVEKLYSSGEFGEAIISREEFDAKRYALEEAKIQSITAAIQAEKAKVDHTLAKQVERQTDLEYQTATYKLSQAVLRSPIDGSITYLVLKPGELVGPSARAFSVVNGEKLEARLFVPQRELARIRVGQEVRIHCEVFADKVFQGRMDVINPVVDKEQGMVQVIVAVTDPQAAGFLKPGMFVNGEIILETRADALLVTKKAILYENQEPILYLVQEGRARRYVLEPGFSDKDFIEVRTLTGRNGLPLEDIPEQGALVLMGHNNLKDGSPVEVDRGG